MRQREFLQLQCFFVAWLPDVRDTRVARCLRSSTSTDQAREGGVTQKAALYYTLPLYLAVYPIPVACSDRTTDCLPVCHVDL